MNVFIALAVGEWAVMTMTELRGAANEKAKRELGRELRYPSWCDRFAAGLGRVAGRHPAGPLESR